MKLETERLYARDLILEDASRMSEYRNKENVAKYQSWDHYSVVDARARIAQCQQLTSYNQIGSDYHLAIILKEEEKMIGDLFVEIVNKKVIMMGYTLDEDYWKHGYATEIVSAFYKHMKKEYGFKKVVCYVYTDNIRSKKLLKRLGFMKFDESYYYDDEGYIKKI